MDSHHARQFLGLAGGSLGLLVAVYVVSFGTSKGRRLDARAARDLDALDAGEHSWQWFSTSADLVRLIVDNAVAFVFLSLVTIAYGLLRRRYAQAILAAVLIAGASVTTQCLKPLLASLDPLGGEATRRLAEGSFPSGHATYAMSVVLSVILIAHPTRPMVLALGGAVWVAAVGVAAVVDFEHYPSDVAAGYLVALAVAACSAAALVSWSGIEKRKAAQRHAAGSRSMTVLVALLVVATALTVVVAVARPNVSADASTRTSSLAVGLGIIALALLIVLVFARLVGSDRSSSRPLDAVKSTL